MTFSLSLSLCNSCNSPLYHCLFLSKHNWYMLTLQSFHLSTLFSSFCSATESKGSTLILTICVKSLLAQFCNTSHKLLGHKERKKTEIYHMLSMSKLFMCSFIYLLNSFYDAKISDLWCKNLWTFWPLKPFCPMLHRFFIGQNVQRLQIFAIFASLLSGILN